MLRLACYSRLVAVPSAHEKHFFAFWRLRVRVPGTFWYYFMWEVRAERRGGGGGESRACGAC